MARPVVAKERVLAGVGLGATLGAAALRAALAFAQDAEAGKPPWAHLADGRTPLRAEHRGNRPALGCIPEGVERDPCTRVRRSPVSVEAKAMPESLQVALTVPRANVRSGPGLTCEVVAQRTKEEGRVTPTGRIGDWFRVEPGPIGGPGTPLTQFMHKSVLADEALDPKARAAIPLLDPDQVPACPPQPTPAVRPTATPEAPVALTGERIEGEHFVIINERTDGIALGINPSWGRGELEAVMAEHAPGWNLKIQVVADKAKVPDRPDGTKGGYGPMINGRLFCSRMVVYDEDNREMTLIVYPEEGFKDLGAERVKDNQWQRCEDQCASDKYADVFMTADLFTVIWSRDPRVFEPGGLASRPERATQDEVRYSGIPGSEKLEALFEWDLLAPVEGGT